MNKESFANGLRIRREVVGQDRVEQSLERATEFSRPLQELATSFAWGEVWGREQELDRRSRSLLTIAMLIALNRSAELEVHLRGGLRNGLTEIEVREVIIHSAVYCGFPAALEAIRVAHRAFEQD